MKRVLATAAALAALGCTSGARAQDIAKSLCDAALKSDGVIDPLTLRSTALKGVDQDTLDYNHDGTVSTDEVFAALTMDAAEFCIVAADGQPGRAKPCPDGAAEALHGADGNLASFWNERGARYDVRDARTPTAQQTDMQQGLKARKWAVLLDDRRRFGTMHCLRPTDVADQDQKGSSRFLLGADIDSLSAKRLPPGQADRLKKVEPARISFTSDNVADTRTFAVDGVAGFRVFDSTRLKLTPFVQYSRTSVHDDATDTSKITGKFAAGALGTFIIGYDQLDLAPLYVRDLKTRAELLGGRFTWRPGFLYRLDPFNNAVHFACARNRPGGACKFRDGLALWTDFQIVSAFGAVLADGNDPDFIANKDYLRVGPSASVHVYGLSGLARDFSLDASAKRLFTLAGGGDPVYSLKVDLSYWVGGSEHLSITSGYERSRDEDTLEATDEWKVGLGVRF